MRLSIEQVGKQYRSGTWALRNISLELRPGVVGLLGSNGAGKSTLMSILATITRPSEGRVCWDGVDSARHPDRLRAVLGYLPQDFGVYPHLNAIEFLEYLAALKGLDRRSARRRIEGLIELVNLADVARRPLGGYSGGMRQRVGIAQALLNEPQLLIVDEPTAGLDPEERARFRSLLTELAGERIVILSTHIVSDVEATASSIALLRKGRLVVHTSPEQLQQAVAGRVWRVVASSEELPRLRMSYLVNGVVRRPDGVHLRVIADTPPSNAVESLPATLEDAFLAFNKGSDAGSDTIGLPSVRTTSETVGVAVSSGR